MIEALTPLPEAILIDADRLQQVVNNLMANALKFTHHGEIRLTVAAWQQLELRVSDSSIGILPDEQHKLFDPWYQATSGKSMSVQGSGQLFICREMVLRMGGDIRPYHGTEVKVTLPLQRCEPVSHASEATLPDYPHLQVAIVYDHPTNLLVMQQQLARFAI